MKFTFKAISVILAIAALLCAFPACKKDPPATYTVWYYDEDGTTLIDTRTFTEGDVLTYPFIDQRSGFNVDWLYFDVNGEYCDYEGIVEQDMKLQLLWQTLDYMVIVSDSLTEEYYYNEYHSYGDVLVPELPPERPGYVFKGFMAEGSTEYATEFVITDYSVIYAVFEAIPYKLILVDNYTGGTISESTVEYGDYTLPGAPNHEGYTFAGWYVLDGVTPVYAGSYNDTYSITKNTKLFAHYTKLETE